MKSEFIEIESMLKSYPRSLIVMNRFKYSNICPHLKTEYYYHQHIIEKVESWLDIMNQPEAELIQYRCFDHKSLDFTAIQLNYANHSTICHKYYSLLSRIYKYEKSTIYH